MTKTVEFSKKKMKKRKIIRRKFNDACLFFLWERGFVFFLGDLTESIVLEDGERAY